MTTTHRVATRNSIADLVASLINIGSTNAQGQLQILTSVAAEVATLDASNPAFGVSSGGTVTADTITDDSSATGGTADNYEFQDRDEDDVFAGSVTATGGGGDIELSTVTIPALGTVQISSFTYTALTDLY